MNPGTAATSAAAVNRFAPASAGQSPPPAEDADAFEEGPPDYHLNRIIGEFQIPTLLVSHDRESVAKLAHTTVSIE